MREPFAAEAIAITVLSHALVEATINAALALGLEYVGKKELFGVLEQANVKHKWTAGPQSFLPSYALPKSDSLYEGLSTLCRRRNAYVHSKITLRDESTKRCYPALRIPVFRLISTPESRCIVFSSFQYDLHQNLVDQVADGSLRFKLEHILSRKAHGAR